MKRTVVAQRTAKPCRTRRRGVASMTPANQRASATLIALTSEQAEQQERARHDEHHERDQLVLEVARLLLDAPRVIDGGGNRAEHAHRRPDHEDAARDAELDLCALQLLELHRDEVELARESSERRIRGRRRDPTRCR